MFWHILCSIPLYLLNEQTLGSLDLVLSRFDFEAELRRPFPMTDKGTTRLPAAFLASRLIYCSYNRHRSRVVVSGI
jgi:hypothetical protein